MMVIIFAMVINNDGRKHVTGVHGDDGDDDDHDKGVGVRGKPEDQCKLNKGVWKTKTWFNLMSTQTICAKFCFQNAYLSKCGPGRMLQDFMGFSLFFTGFHGNALDLFFSQIST